MTIFFSRIGKKTSVGFQHMGHGYPIIPHRGEPFCAWGRVQVVGRQFPEAQDWATLQPRANRLFTSASLCQILQEPPIRRQERKPIPAGGQSDFKGRQDIRTVSRSFFLYSMWFVSTTSSRGQISSPNRSGQGTGGRPL